MTELACQHQAHPLSLVQRPDLVDPPLPFRRAFLVANEDDEGIIYGVSPYQEL